VCVCAGGGGQQHVQVRKKSYRTKGLEEKKEKKGNDGSVMVAAHALTIYTKGTPVMCLISIRVFLFSFSFHAYGQMIEALQYIMKGKSNYTPVHSNSSSSITKAKGSIYTIR
jgi:hypothetical protein